ncbi:MAG: hypothetical protein ABFR32_09310 [Bacteroidota bacterium]
MKLLKVFLAIVIISSIAVSCKNDTKKEEVKDAVEVAEDATKTVEEKGTTTEKNVEASSEGTKAVEESIETTTKDIPVEEGVILETAAHTPVIYPGCEGTNEEIRACSIKEFEKFVSKNFNTELASNLDLESGDHKIRAFIKIDETGKASVMRVDAEKEEIKKEVVRVIDKLPQMTPATHDGAPVSVSFLLPVNFKIN